MPACFRLKATPDRLEVRAIFMAAPPPGWSPREILDALAAEGILHGILHDEIEALSTAARAGESHLVAAGDPAIHGSPGRVEELKTPGGVVSPRVFMDGSVDFHEAATFTRVRKGMRLLRRVQPRPGIEGTDVQGTAIPAAASLPVDWPPAQGLAADPDDAAFLAADCDGILVRAGETLAVEPGLVIDGDVGPATGNVDSPGHVTVSGSVRAGFSVRAGAGLEVAGSIEPATVEVRGNLVVREGILGGPLLSVHATGDLAARYAENARVVCGGDLFLERSAMNCQLTARGSIYVRGNLVSGSAVACRRIESANFGSPIGVPLHLCLGYTPAVCDALDRIFAGRVELERHRWTLAESLAGLAGAAFLKHRDLRRIPEPLRDPARERLEEIARVEKDLSRLAAEQRDLIRDKKSEVPDAAASFSGQLHSDVQVNIGPHSERFLDDLKGPLSLTGEILARVNTPVALGVSVELRPVLEEGFRQLGYRLFLFPDPPRAGSPADPGWLAGGRVICLEPAFVGPDGSAALARMFAGGKPSGARIIAFATGDALADRSLLPEVPVDAWVDAPDKTPAPEWFREGKTGQIL